jgi:AcrR family transcriptional regulator
MEPKKADGIRARVRAEMIGEIKSAARRRLATDGANLSLRAIARELGLVSSALYRYFASRDDLLTALILDAYNDLGAAAEQADAAITDRADGRARWLAVARAIRAWAVAKPAEYALLYGSPVPGYAAPPETTVAAQRPPQVLGRIFAETGQPYPPAMTVNLALGAEIARLRDLLAPGVSESAMARGMIAWTLLFGALNFELFGRFDTTIRERAGWFDLQMTAMADYLGLPT